MEAEGSIISCFDDPTNKSFTDQEPSGNRRPSSSPPDAMLPSAACFDCSICLESATDPVVTLCGHLYCWPCIYKWMQLDSPRHCPVCKSAVSLNALIPLYGRGNKTELKTPGIPNRPVVLRDAIASLIEDEQEQQQQQQPSSRRNPMQQQHYGGTGTVSWAAGGVLGGLALGILPWVSSNSAANEGELYTSRLNRLNTYGYSGRQRRQERKVEAWLHQIWAFLICCAVLCLFFF